MENCERQEGHPPPFLGEEHQQKSNPDPAKNAMQQIMVIAFVKRRVFPLMAGHGVHDQAQPVKVRHHASQRDQPAVTQVVRKR